MFKFLSKLMSCGSCGSDAPHGENKCMACECPCDEHKEHNHPAEESGKEAGSCSSCGKEHKKGEKCGCC